MPSEVVETPMYDKPEHFKNFDNLPEEMLRSQKAELALIKEIIRELSNSLGRTLRVLDIGVGNGRFLRELAEDAEVWSEVESYHAIDVADKCIDTTTALIRDEGIQKVGIQKLDAVDLDKLDGSFDLIISTWFTVGNFYPEDFPFKDYEPGSYGMDENPKFTDIMNKAYNLLEQGGEIVVGSMYVDNDDTRVTQERIYVDTWDWEIISGPEDPFCATSSKWWSLRFTEDIFKRYVSPFADSDQVTFVALDQDDFAMLGRVRKV